LIKVSILEVEEFTMDDQLPEAPQDKNNLEEVLAPTSTMGQPAEASQRDHKASPAGYEHEHEEWQKAKKKAKQRMNILRVIVLFAGASYYRMCWIDDEIWS
jgi:Zn-finger nucleic acid-binding protein